MTITPAGPHRPHLLLKRKWAQEQGALGEVEGKEKGLPRSLKKLLDARVVKHRLLHWWLSLVVVVYKVQQYPLLVVSVFGLGGNDQQ